MGRLRLRFSPMKCVVMVWGASHIWPSETWRLQGSEIPLSASMKYLGVRLTTGADYFSAYEKDLRVRAARYEGLLCQSTLWSYNCYEVMRVLWKMVALPGLTYANARCQREIGRLALGVHKHTSVGAVQGEMGWSSFMAREATAKIYEADRGATPMFRATASVPGESRRGAEDQTSLSAAQCKI
ncbi:hypothetical protein HPB50_025700 [Hyalomma asiaticum]|uniref:Uncharacterized protein n=1 Tax=Hyalomma asiaticum TaxID=266040 RepID=A0ACB7RQA3_HYAAI|nr:hypothetical protein HPB50_025700 [Hyalomma asiaticum]